MSVDSSLDASVLDWLLEPETPSVRFWALQDLLGLERTHRDVEAAQDAVMESEPVKTILSAQQPEGHWENHDDMYNPKYTASTHSLLILAELGARRTYEIERGLEHVFEFQRDSGHFLTGLPKTARGRASVVKDGSCLDANVLYYREFRITSGFRLFQSPRLTL